MNYGGNMPDWHQYNSTQPIGSEVPSNGQNVNHSPIFGPTISPRRLNGPAYSPEGLNKPQNEASFNPRSFQQSPNTLNGPNVPSENSPMGSSGQIPGSHVHYGAPSPRNSMIEGANPSLESRTVPGSLSEAINQRNQQISMSRPAGQLNCPTTINGSMGPMAQRNAPTNIQPSIPANNRQGQGTYVPCKGPCCNPDTSISYQSWEKFGPYSPNVPYRDTGYPVDNRRFGNEFENREQLGTSGVYAVDPRRNFSDYKYRKDPIVPRAYPHPSGVIQNYPVQNYNFPADYQKYPGYPVKEYPRENPIANTQNPAILKYQEQSVIVQQKYFTKPVQYQNGVIPKNIVPTSMGGNVLSRPQESYFNPQLARNFPRAYSENTAIPNRRIRSTDPIHTSYPEYPMYQQKIAMQRYTMENQLRDLTRIPGYQSHPKYQESVLRYRELLRLQQNVDYQSTVQDAPKALTSQGGEDIPPINLQFDQNGVLINTSFQPAGYSSNLQSPVNIQNSKNVQSVSSAEVRPLNLQQPERFRVQAAFDNRRQDHIQNQVPPSLPQPELPRETQQRYPVMSHQPQAQKFDTETLNLSNTDDSKTPSVEKRNSKDFADKPELDVRQFLATWDESEDEDGANANLPDVVLSNSTLGALPEHENTTAVLGSAEEAKNCSENEDCRSRDDCGVFDSTQNVTKPCNSSDNQTYRSELRSGVASTASRELDLSTSNPERQPVRTGTVIQSTSIECSNETPIHKLENFTNSQATNLSCRVTKSLNTNESQEPPATVEADVIVKKESPVEEETLTSIKEHIEAYEQEAKTEIRSNDEDVIENGEDSRSGCGKESSENMKNQFESEDDPSESSDSDSTSSDSMSSFVKSPKTIHGTEIHVNAQELSANPASPKNDSEMVESPNLQKQSSLASEESHNPDDISLPDLPTSECTPISTALNTPIHSDSEESSDPVIDLTTPANPIEIIQNSPMLSFTHSPIKMEPYEHLDENDSTDKTSHLEFQTSNSCDNDYGRLTDVSSHTTEQFNVAHNDEDTFDSDCIEILSEKAEQQRKERETEAKNHVTDDIADGKPFAFNDETVMATDTTNNARVDADRDPWPSVSAMEHDTQSSNSTEHEGVNTVTEKSEIPSEMDTRLSLKSEAAEEDKSNDHMAHLSRSKNYHSTSRWLAKCESTENLTALNLVKDEIKINDEPENLQIAAEECRYQTDGKDVEECCSTIENQLAPTASKNTDQYSSSSEEDNVYSETEEDRSRFPGTSNIPLIPGEDFEEPKMPVLPMEGNCLTKILKNTSPITDLDVLGSDDEKLDKMDEIWMEVGGVDTVGKISSANTDCGEGFNREKSSRQRLRMFHKTEKRVKHQAEAKDTGESIGQGWNESDDKKSRNDTNWQEYKANIAQKETNPINRDFQGAVVSGTDDTAAMTQDKRSFSKTPIFPNSTSRSHCEDSDNPSNDICSETITTTEIMKCKEKADHINDIATKLLENARLCEPEQTNESPEEQGRDSSRKRIKLLKEFRKIKNKVMVDKPEDESVKSEDGVESQAVVCKTTDRCEETNVKALNEKEIDRISQVPDTLIESRSPGPENVNAEEYTSDPVSADVTTVDEKLPQTSNGSEETIESENTAWKNDGNVNMGGSITVENNSCVNSHQILNTKAVVPVERNDINECAINLSKSSNDFGSSNTTLGSKGCVIDDSQDSNVSKNDQTTLLANTTSEITRESIPAETKDQTTSLPRSPSTEDNASHSEVEEAAADTLPETKPVEDENITASNCESNSSPRPTNFAEEYVFIENDEQGRDQEASGNTDHVALKESSSSPEKGEDPPLWSSENLEESTDSIYDNCNKSPCILEPNEVEAMNTPVFEQSEDLNSHQPPTVDNAEDKKSVDRTKESGETCDADNLQHVVINEPTAEGGETNQLTDSFHDDGEKSFFNPPVNEEMAIQSFEYPPQSESNAEFMDNSPDPPSVPGTEKDVGGPLLVEAASKIIIERSADVEKTFQDLDLTLDMHKEPLTVPMDFGSIENHSILNDFPIESPSREPRETDSLNLAPEPVPGTDGGTSTACASMVTFGLEDPFNCDFNNFDVAPNINDIMTADESNSWKYSKAYARFEDCERYKNPDNFVDPILTSLESLGNLNTVPVYTTKDGKITYSPNPKFTYRALIMEAREREGYPSMRASCYGNPRTQESSHSSKSQASVRKRKNSEGHSYSSGSYSKKNYTENYKPREHGESSMKKSPESWNRNCFGNDKYRRKSRDRSSHNFTPHNGDVEKKYTAEKIGHERVSRSYRQREESHAVFDERNRKKNGTSDRLKSNNRTQFRQSKEQSTSDSVWSASKRDVKGDQKTSAITQPRSESGKTNDVKKIKTSRSSSSTEKRLNNDNQGKEFDNGTEKSMPSSDKKIQGDQFTSDIPLPEPEQSSTSDKQIAERNSIDLEVKEIKTVSLTSQDQPSIEQSSMAISYNESNGGDSPPRLELSSLNWEERCENFFLPQGDILELTESAKSLLNEIEENKLYEEVDDIREDSTSVLHETDAIDHSEIQPEDSVEAIIETERIEDTDCIQKKCNIEEDESILNDGVQKDDISSLSLDLNRIDERINDQEIPERPKTPNENESAASPVEEIKSIEDEEKPVETLTHIDDRIIKDMEKGNEETEIASSIHIGDEVEVEADTVASGSNEQVLHSSEESISSETPAKTEKRDTKFKSHKIKSEIKGGTLAKNIHPPTTDDENLSKSQTQLDNYISYSPANESADDTRAIPKLVIKKTDSLNCKNIGLGPLSTAAHDLFAERVLDKDDQGSKSTGHPKIPKILIRNAKSRPTTPSIEEITEETSFSVTTKEENKVPKVKIRFEDKRSRSPPSTENNSKTDSTENKIPKMKIKLEDRLSKVFIENVNEDSGTNDAVQKTIPKMKIKKCKGALRHVADTRILPVSIPRMFIYTELEGKKERGSQTLTQNESNTIDKNCTTVAPSSGQEEKKNAESDVKKIPKLKIKRQSSGCSIELNRKRHSISPVQSDLKKVRKSLKASETNDKKQSGKTTSGPEHQESQIKVDTFGVKESYEVTRFENVAVTDQPQASESIQHEEITSKRETSGTPQEIPKVIIKRASPSAEFKCELSKRKTDAIIRNKRWQPEVKLQRSWVLDCMAKDLNLEKLTLKLATPGSILKKCLTEKEPDIGKSHAKNDSVNTDENKQKLFRSKSASELIFAQGSSEMLARNIIGFVTHKRCKSDLGSRFSTYSANLESRKKIRNYNHSTLEIEKEDTFMPIVSSTGLNSSRSHNEGVNFMEPSARSPLDENMNSKKEIPAPTNDLDALDRPSFDSDLDTKTSTSIVNRSKSECECFENSEEFTIISMSDSEHRKKSEVSKDSTITWNGNVKTVVGEKVTEEIRRESCIEFDDRSRCTADESVEHNGAFSAGNISVDHTEEERTAELAAMLMGSHDHAESVIIDTGIPGESAVLRTANSVKPDILMLKSELTCADAAETVDHRQTDTTYKLDINDNSDSHMRELEMSNAVRDKLESYINAAEQQNTSTLNDNVLTESLEANTIDLVNSITRMEYSKESQSIIEMLSDSPNRETEIQSGPTSIGENGICLYHEDAIPTQFELELEVMDNTESDLEVPIPQEDYSEDETNEPFNSSRNRVMIDPKCDTTLPKQDEAITQQGDRGALSSKETEKRKTTFDSLVKGMDIEKSLNCTDSLVKEVLAAKEMLKKCLARSKNGSRIKPKARPKTAAEKKQGSSFDFSRLAAAVSEERFNKLDNRLSIDITTGANCLRLFDGKSTGGNGDEKLCQNQSETEYKVNRIKSDKKHSKSGKSSLIMKKKYSSLPKNVDKLTDLTQIEEYLIPKNISTDAKDSVECMKLGETSVSLKNSKLFIKNSSHSDTKKKIPELKNSKDSKSRTNTKSSRHDFNSKYAGKSKSEAQNIAPRESSLDIGPTNEKSVSDAAKHKYKSSKASSDQNVNSTADKTKFKLYKIPKLGKPDHEELEKSRIKEARMPILEPQVDLNPGIEASELSSDREISRSPPLITNQETSQSLKHQIMTNEDLAEQRTTLPDTPEATQLDFKGRTVVDIVNNMAYHEKATIRHRRYCTLCERWFPTVTRHRRHLSGYQHRHTELTQRRTIHALFTLFTGKPCPRLQPPGVVRIDCEPGELTPLQIAVQGVTQESSEADDANITKPSREDK